MAESSNIIGASSSAGEAATQSKDIQYMTRPPANAEPAGELIEVFNYRKLPPDQREWLRKTTAEIKSSTKKVTYHYLDMCRKLREVRLRLSHGQWIGWVEAEFAWSLRTAQRFVQVAERFAEIFEDPRQSALIDNFDPSSLYVLSQSRPALDHALTIAQDGGRITHAVARNIVHAQRAEPDVSAGEMRKLAPLQPADRRPVEVQNAPKPPAIQPAWAALVDMFDDISAIHITRVEDEDVTTYSATVYRENDRPRHAVRKSIEDLIFAISGREPSKVCQGACGLALPLGEFTRDANRPDGRTNYCQKCERARIADSKRRKKARLAQEAQEAQEVQEVQEAEGGSSSEAAAPPA